MIKSASVHRMLVGCSALVTWGALALVGPAVTYAGADTLRSVVPADAGLYVEFPQLAASAEQLRSGELYARLTEFPPIASWQRQQLPALRLIAGQAALQIGVSAAELQEKVLGGSVAIALWPEPTVKEETPDGLIVIDSTDGDLLQRAISGLISARRLGGEIRSVREVTHAGATYRDCTLARGDAPPWHEYYAVSGNLGLISNRDTVIRTALELAQRGTSPQGSLAASASFNDAIARTGEQAAMRVYLNPRPWQATFAAAAEVARVKEAELEAARANDDARQQSDSSQNKVTNTDATATADDGSSSDEDATLDEDAPQNESQSLAAVATLLSGFDSLVVWADLEQGVSLSSYAAINREQMPAGLSAAVGSFAGGAEFLELVPDDALLAMAGRMDGGSLLKQLWPLLDEKSAREARGLGNVAAAALGGLDLYEDVLGGLGPNFGSYVVPAEKDDPAQLPLDMVAAVECKNGSESTGDPQLQRVMDDVLKLLLTVAAIAHNAEQSGQVAVVKSLDHLGVRLTWVEGWRDVPAGMMLTYGVARGYLLIGSSQRAVLDAVGRKSSRTLSQALEPLLGAAQLPAGERPSQVVYLNLAATRRFLNQFRQPLAISVATAKGVEVEQAEKALDRLGVICRLADTLLLTKQIDRSGIATSLQIIANR